jgi:hypothetical protein
MMKYGLITLAACVENMQSILQKAKAFPNSGFAHLFFGEESCTFRPQTDSFTPSLMLFFDLGLICIHHRFWNASVDMHTFGISMNNEEGGGE